MKQSKEERRAAAKARNEHWATKSPKEQLADLDRRLGKGVGAAKQRAKILKRIAEEQRGKAKKDEKAKAKA